MEKFRLYERKLKTKTLYYYETYDEKGKRHQYSTECAIYDEALKKCLELEKNGLLIRPNKKTLKSFTRNFFDREKCPLNMRQKRRGRSWSRSHMETMKNCLSKHILPKFGNKALNSITSYQIEEFLFSLVEIKGLSHATANRVLTTFYHILNEAVRRDIITTNPTKQVETLIEKKIKKGILNSKEVELLFHPQTINEIWGSSLHYMINLIACYTGMRLGEIQALGCSNLIVNKDKSGFLAVSTSFDRKEGIKPCKNNGERLIPIPEWLTSLLISWSKKHNSSFWFTCDNKKPIDHRAIQRKLVKALNNIGISEQQQRQKKISFHSWRHRYISELSGIIPQEQLMLIVGHSSSSMTQHYTQQIPEKTIELLPSMLNDSKIFNR